MVGRLRVIVANHVVRVAYNDSQELSEGMERPRPSLSIGSSLLFIYRHTLESLIVRQQVRVSTYIILSNAISHAIGS